MTFSVSEISRLLLGPLGVILVDFGGLLGACWGQLGRPLVPLGILWSAVETLGSLCDPFGPLMVSFWNPCAPCGLLLDTSRSVLGCFWSSWDLSWCILGLNCMFYMCFAGIGRISLLYAAVWSSFFCSRPTGAFRLLLFRFLAPFGVPLGTHLGTFWCILGS